MHAQSPTTHGPLIGVAQFPGARVARFLQPDLRDHLYDDTDLTQTRLYQELRHRALAGLQADETLVLNLGLVEPLPTVFYHLLLKVRQAVQAQGAQLVLCRLSPEHREIFELVHGFRLFPVAATERQALLEAGVERACLTEGVS
jgi:anti-anti-sigma regulatory factor